VIVMRHNSTPFAFTEAIWAKYGIPISRQANFINPNNNAAPVNVFSRQLEGLTKRGVHLAVCQMSMRTHAGAISRVTGGNADDIYNELAVNLSPNSKGVPAGIITVNRAQERGYAFVHTA